MTDATDWEIDANGLYVATRSFLARRGFCCANQCRNCPYINWRNSPAWQPLSAEMVKVAAVSPKALEGARKALAQHEQRDQQENPSEAAYNQTMIAHYRLLLERWEPSGD
jgi:hypothetical protein